MPTKAELESELTTLRAKLASLSGANYIHKVNPNLIVVLHYAGKALWLGLAAVFGIIGFKLYAIGVQATGDATATLLYRNLLLIERCGARAIRDGCRPPMLSCGCGKGKS